MRIHMGYRKLLIVLLINVSASCAHSSRADAPRISVSYDGSNLNLEMSGNFQKDSHIGFFIDADNNPNTGYARKWGGNKYIKGADFLVQSDGLYRYPKGATGWKWDKVTSDVSMTQGAGKVSARIPLKSIEFGDTVIIKGDIASRDWQRHRYSRETKFRLDSKIDSIAVSDDGADLILKMNGRFLNGVHSSFYIDIDDNPLTGYSSKGKNTNIRGADFLVQANGLYQYPKEAQGWRWEKVSSNILMNSGVSEVQARVPLKLLGSRNTIRVKAEVASNDWHRHIYSNDIAYLLGDSGVVVGDGALSVALKKTNHGMEVKSIKVRGGDVLSAPSDLFALSISGFDELSSHEGWGRVTTRKMGQGLQIVFTQPQENGLPENLKVTASIQVRDGVSDWDLAVTGLEDHSLMDVSFPRFNIRADGDDHFFVPNRFGQVFDNPGSGMPEFKAIYPMGWGASMQYMAYYNSRYGLYFGSHDPKASLKTLTASGNLGSIAVNIENPAPNRTIAGNDWEFPGFFELAAYQGDWYDAALIYKGWVYEEADYRPPENRPVRAKNLGEISVWLRQNIYGDISSGHTAKDLGDLLEPLKRELSTDDQPVTLGIYWLSIHDDLNENNLPKLYPSDDTKYLVNRFEREGVPTMLYGNGYLYDMDISNSDMIVPGFGEAKRYSAKNRDGFLYTQRWNDHTFARMCPTQKGWRDILSRVHGKFVAPLGTAGIFLDQVTAATPVQCYDKDHGHPLGGGHYWRDGYKKLIEDVRSKYSPGTFVVSESVNDSLMDTVDGYEAQNRRFLINNQVPAIQVVYGGKVQFIGPTSAAGSYQNGVSSEDLFGMSAYAFALGATQGYFYPELLQNQPALQYVRKLARLREKLKSFIAFGEMERPINLRGTVPEITIGRGVGETRVEIDIPAIQAGVWRSEDKDSVVFVYVNGQTPGNAPISFSPEINFSEYGLTGQFSIKRVREDGETSIEELPNQITLPSADAVAFIVTRK